MAGADYLSAQVRKMVSSLAEDGWSQHAFDERVRELSAVASALQHFGLVTLEEAQAAIKDLYAFAGARRIPDLPEGAVHEAVQAALGVKGFSAIAGRDARLPGSSRPVQEHPLLLRVIPVGRPLGVVADCDVTMLSVDLWGTHFKIQVAATRRTEPEAPRQRSPTLLADVEWQVRDDSGNDYVPSGGGAGMRSTGIVYVDMVFRPQLHATASTLFVELSDRDGVTVDCDVPISDLQDQ